METRSRNLDVMYSLASRVDNLGKTAMMKLIFMLQEVYNVPLGYDFEIYTYGPYSSEVMDDIDLADILDVLEVKSITYQSGQSGYSITAENEPYNLNEEYIGEIDKVVSLLGDKRAKELELLSTIVFVYKSAVQNGWDCSKLSVCKDVHEIKPHFSEDYIMENYDFLEQEGIFKLLED